MSTKVVTDGGRVGHEMTVNRICENCGKGFFYVYPGFGRYRALCDDCGDLAKREKVRQRVAKYRARVRDTGGDVLVAPCKRSLDNGDDLVVGPCEDLRASGIRSLGEIAYAAFLSRWGLKHEYPIYPSDYSVRGRLGVSGLLDGNGLACSAG